VNAFHSYGDVSDVTLAADAAAGDFVQVAGMAGFLPTGGKSGETVAAQVRGLVRVDSLSAATFAVGATVEIETTDMTAVADTAGDFDIGTAEVAKIAGETSVLVRLNGV
jgi:predicted RecA/RadA family phage recombinase